MVAHEVDAFLRKPFQPRPAQVALAVPADVEINEPIAVFASPRLRTQLGAAVPPLVDDHPDVMTGVSHDIRKAGSIRKSPCAWRYARRSSATRRSASPPRLRAWGA